MLLLVGLRRSFVRTFRSDWPTTRAAESCRARPNARRSCHRRPGTDRRRRSACARASPRLRSARSSLRQAPCGSCGRRWRIRGWPGAAARWPARYGPNPGRPLWQRTNELGQAFDPVFDREVVLDVATRVFERRRIAGLEALEKVADDQLPGGHAGRYGKSDRAVEPRQEAAD